SGALDAPPQGARRRGRGGARDDRSASAGAGGGGRLAACGGLGGGEAEADHRTAALVVTPDGDPAVRLGHLGHQAQPEPHPGWGALAGLLAPGEGPEGVVADQPEAVALVVDEHLDVAVAAGDA